MAINTLHQNLDERSPVIVDLDINGVRPFWSAPDSVNDCLAEAHAQLTMLAEAHDLSEAFGIEPQTRNGVLHDNGIDSMRDGIKAMALKGVARILAVAQHLGDVADYDRRQARRAGGTTPFRVAYAKFRAAEKRFNGLPRDLEEVDPAAFEREENAYGDAHDAVDFAPIADWDEFADAFEIAFAGGGNPNEEHKAKLLADVRRLRRP